MRAVNGASADGPYALYGAAAQRRHPAGLEVVLAFQRATITCSPPGSDCRVAVELGIDDDDALRAWFYRRWAALSALRRPA